MLPIELLPPPALIPGLAAALGWGIGDFVARFVAREIGAFRGLFYLQFFGLAALGVVIVATGDAARLADISGGAWAWMALGCGLNVLASFALFRAFEIGILTLVSPIAASYGALTGILAYLSGERLGTAKIAALSAVTIGVLLASTSPPEPGTKRSWRALPPGVAWAMTGSVVFGILFWLLGFKITPSFGPYLPIFLFRLVTPFVLAALAVPLAQRLTVPRGRVLGLLLAVSLLDTTAFVASTIGVSRGDVTLTTVLTSLFSAVTVLLAAIFLRERVAPWQWVGVAILLVATPFTQL